MKVRRWSCNKTMQAHTSKRFKASGFMTCSTRWGGHTNLKRRKVDVMLCIVFMCIYSMSICMLTRLFICCMLPIGPYTNVLDLYLFPSISHRHSAHLQR